jgi:anti-anti-sigma factor
MTPSIIVSIDQDQLVVSLRGDFDLAAHPLLRGLGSQLTPTGPRGLVVNLSEVGIIDCAGVRMVAQLMRAWIDDGRSALCVCPDGLVATVLRLTGFSRRYAVVPTYVPADPADGSSELRFLLRASHAAS